MEQCATAYTSEKKNRIKTKEVSSGFKTAIKLKRYVKRVS